MSINYYLNDLFDNVSKQKEPICLSEGFFTSVLLQPDGHIAYFGTSQGCVEIWDLKLMEKKTEVRYLIFNEFNEQIPIQDPVVNLAAPANFEYVYAFMGVAAYCIDTKLGTIIQQIPISEKVLWGSVSPEKGEIGVLTISGYLSRWSPTFFERTGSIEFDQKLEKGYVLHDFDESRIIIVLGLGKVIVGNLEGERYVINFEIPISDQYLNSSGYDKNPYHTVHLVEGCIFVGSNNGNDEIEIPAILKDGRMNSEFQLRNLIKMKEDEGVERNYISDLRFSRDSRDRYTAELDSLGQDTHHESTIGDDSKTLHYALQEYQNEDLDTKSKALSVINRMSGRYNISLRSIQFSRLLHDNSTKLIEKAQKFDGLTNSRQSHIQKTISLSLSISIILLFLASSFKVTILILIILTFVALLQIVIIIYIRLINSDPKLPWVREYKALRFLNILTLLVSIVIAVVRFNGINIPLIDSL